MHRAYIGAALGPSIARREVVLGPRHYGIKRSGGVERRPAERAEAGILAVDLDAITPVTTLAKIRAKSQAEKGR